MSERSRILVIDDARPVTRALRASLSSHGYRVKVANDAQTGLAIVRKWSPDLVIADLSMQKMSGIKMCGRIRQHTEAPIIVLTRRGHNGSKSKAFEKGADDYITKPFSIDDLLARVRANLWRLEPGIRYTSPKPIEAGDFRIDPEARTVLVRGKEVRLTPKEFGLLVYMARNAGKVLPHRALLTAVWCGRTDRPPEDLRVYVNTLRKKIEPGKTPLYILTEPWTGYRFQPKKS